MEEYAKRKLILSPLSREERRRVLLMGCGLLTFVDKIDGFILLKIMQTERIQSRGVPTHTAQDQRKGKKTEEGLRALWLSGFRVPACVLWEDGQ